MMHEVIIHGTEVQGKWELTASISYQDDAQKRWVKIVSYTSTHKIMDMLQELGDSLECVNIQLKFNWVPSSSMISSFPPPSSSDTGHCNSLYSRAKKMAEEDSKPYSH